MNGEIAFEPALRERVALLKGLDVVGDRPHHRAAHHARLPAASSWSPPCARHGAWTALVSGGFDVFTGPIAARIGFQENRANRLLEADGRLTGAVAEPILGRAAKAAALDEICGAPWPDAGRRDRRRRRRQRPRHDSRLPEPAWRCTPSRWSPPRPGCASTMATSPRCSTSRATAATSSPHEADAHAAPDHPQLGRARPRPVPPHQFRRAR